ncbi:MAG: hypothetical protein QOC55_701, partial [Thermoleophilaceae bacterium]|nr:hypothetical protein [Thermoleophilaceae bacterium]
MTVVATGSRTKSPARLAGAAVLACQSDERLVELVRDGHERAFDAIVDRYRKALVNFCQRILPESRTEDAVQQAFLNAHTALAGSDEPVQLKPWLFTITRNAALNMLRQNGWNYDEIPLDFDGVRRPDQVVEQRIELQQTVAAVKGLPDRQRSALVMRELEGRSYEEIALALGTGDGAVRQLLNRARGSLRSVASLLIPPPVVVRAASALPPTDGRRTAEVLGSLGAAGMAKAGATALVAGSLVIGAVEGPLPLTHHHATGVTHQGLSADKTSRRAHAAAAAVLIPATDRGGHGQSAGDSQHRGSSSPGHGGGSRNSGSHHVRSETRHTGRDGSGENRS